MTPFILEFSETRQTLHNNSWSNHRNFWNDDPFSNGYFPIFICHNKESSKIADDFLEYIDFYKLRSEQKVTLEFMLISREKFLQNISNNLNDFVKRYNLNDYINSYNKPNT